MENVTPPARRALAVLDQPPVADAAQAPRKRISKKIIAAIDKMVSGESKKITEAAAAVGMPRETLSRALSRPHVAELLRTKVLRTLAMAAARAGATKVDLLDSDNAIARDRASTFILGLADIQPASSPTVAISLELKAGYVIDLTDEPPQMRTISP
jgi:DNA-binding phage protein